MKRLTIGMAVVMMVAVAMAADAPKANRLDTRVYVVEDLVLTAKQKAAIAENKGVMTPETKPDFEPVLDLLTTSVAPDSWTKDEGKDGRTGTMTPFYLNRSLIIRATPEVHEQVVKRLRQVRRLAAVRGDG